MKSLFTIPYSLIHWQVVSRAKLFSTGFIQVFFVAINTYFLSKSYFLGVFSASFMISMVWSYNVKKVAFGSVRDRIAYALGAAFGSVAGLSMSVGILNVLKL